MNELNLCGQTLGRFEILDELGRGGMAMVYKARQTDLDRIVALKVLPPTLALDTDYITRFQLEARRAARLEHPHIVPIYDVGEDENLHFIAMKYVEGVTLKELVEREGPLSMRRVVDLLLQVGQALSYAHRRDIVHRDVKPSNIIVTDEDWAYLSDFGLAVDIGGTPGITRDGMILGTPEYMSPEQAQGRAEVGPATDIYAFGVVLYEVLSGTFPFQADTPMGMLAARLTHAPRPIHDIRADLPRALETVIMQALARDPEDRFSTAEALVTALRYVATQIEDEEQAYEQGGVSADSPTQVAPSPFALPADRSASAQGMPAVGPTKRLPRQLAGDRCAACGTLNPADAIFCVECGRSLSPVPSESLSASLALPEEHPLDRRPEPAPLTPERPQRKKKGWRSPAMWGGASTGVFMIGLAILFFTNTIWPGILVLVGLTGLLSSSAAGRPWEGVEGAVFMVGLAILFATNLIWPGILVLIGVSALVGTLRRW